ncbi:hypothetical protein H4219_001073 [Mycoemilia scoparia]|uniref:ENTH domain-containing protein n=1 Tax=Mycoemilia scoparia TaxID=417184 RepID=A0A9W8DQU8_9FUNG|nr:hypothetical protein H4219_001073 [Mycoemilia scoparia]
MEKAVVKATRKDVVHPKLKHVTNVMVGGITSGYIHAAKRSICRSKLGAFKGLIVVHILMQEGNGPAIYDFLSKNTHVLNMEKFRDRNGTRAIEQTKNIRLYANYLCDRMLAYKSTRLDYMSKRITTGSQIYAVKVTDTKFLLLEVSTVQKLLHSLFKSRFDTDTLDNETTFSGFRYMLRDSLKLFQVMNEGVMKMLRVYFELNNTDMRRALDLYKRFIRLTERMDEYLMAARRFESIFGFSIPKLTHAPVSLAKGLEDYLNLPESEKQATKKDIKTQSNSNSKSGASQGLKLKEKSKSGQADQPSQAKATAKKETEDMIDFFASIDEPSQPAIPQNTSLENTFQALSNPFDAGNANLNNNQADINMLLQQQAQNATPFNTSQFSAPQQNPMQFDMGQVSSIQNTQTQAMSPFDNFALAPQMSAIDSNPFRASMMVPNNTSINPYQQPQPVPNVQNNRASYNPFAQTLETNQNMNNTVDVFGTPLNNTAITNNNSFATSNMQGQTGNLNDPFSPFNSSQSSTPFQTSSQATSINWNQSGATPLNNDPFAAFNLNNMKTHHSATPTSTGATNQSQVNNANGNFANFNVFQ